MPADSSQLSFLVVEDGEIDRKDILSTIQSKFNAPSNQIISSNAEFNKFKRSLPERGFDIAIVDLYFGKKKDGMSIIEWLSSHQKTMPIIAISSTSDVENDKLAALAVGADIFLNKNDPEFLDNLATLINTMLASAKYRRRFVNMIHISDLHFTANDDPNTIASLIKSDIDKFLPHFNCGDIDVLVVSGDITNSGAEVEFAVAEQFLKRTMENLRISQSRLVIIPGNHDVDWSVPCYKWYPASQATSDATSRLFEIALPLGILRRDDSVYGARFRNFEVFFNRLGSGNYKLEEEHQAWVVDFPDLDVQFLCGNTAWNLDECTSSKFYRTLSPQGIGGAISISDRAVTSAINCLSKDRLFTLAVVHHPIRQHAALAHDSFIGRLYEAGVRVILHGDTHALTRDEMTGELWGSRLHVVGCGTVSFKRRAPGSYPLYHFLRLDKRRQELMIHTRYQESEGGTFQPYSRWKSDPVNTSSTYKIELAPK